MMIMRSYQCNTDDFEYTDDDSCDLYSNNEGPENNVHTPLDVHDVYTDTEADTEGETSVLEISSSDNSP